MLHRLKCGSTQENNQWRLPEGVVTWDRELKQLRLHNGRLPGGFAVQAERAYVPPDNGPGSQALLNGDDQLGYYGIVSNKMLTNGPDFMARVGITTTTTQNPDIDWLKFAWQGRTLFVATKTITYDAPSWNTLNAAGLIKGQKEIAIDGHRYRVRVLKAIDADVQTVTARDISTNPTWLHQSEWNQLMYRVAASAPSNAKEWDTLSDTALGLTNTRGGVSYGAETNAAGTRVTSRGFYNAVKERVAFYTDCDTSEGHVTWGWRPVLELIE